MNKSFLTILISLFLVLGVYAIAPTFTDTIPDQDWDEDTSLSNAFDLDAYFSDPENGSLTYSVSGNDTIIVSIATNGVVSFSQSADWHGQEIITFTAEDNESLTVDSNDIVLTVNPVADNPVLTLVPSTDQIIVMQDEPINTITVSATDVDNHLLTLSAQNLPSSASFPNKTGIGSVTQDFSWTPTEDDIGEYKITFKVTDVDSKEDSKNIIIEVVPDFCDIDDEKGLKIEDIDFDDEDYNPLDTVKVDVDVEALAEDKEDVEVEIILWNLDKNKEIDSWTSGKQDIDDGDEETFEIDFEIPNDEDIGKDDDYLLYVVATGEDGDGDDHCIVASEEITIEREDHDVRIISIEAIPSEVSCGETFDLEVKIENLGTKDEDDVYVKVLDPELKIDEKSSNYDLEDYKGDNDATVRINDIEIPEDAEEKTYSVEVLVYFDDGDETYSTFFNLKVSECEAVPEAVPEEGNVYQLDLTTPTTQLMVENDIATFTLLGTLHTLEINSVSENSIVFTLSSNGPQTLSLNVGESISLDLNNDNIKDLSIKLNSISNKKALITLTRLEQLSTEFIPITTASVWDKLTESNMFLIIADVLLVILLIIALALIFRKKPKA